MPNKEIENPDSYAEQQYFAFERNTEVIATLENIKIISTPILEARLKKVKHDPFSDGREEFEISAEINLITDELTEREKEEEKTKDLKSTQVI